MDKLYNILRDRGYQPVYNKYDEVINAFRIRIYKLKARKYMIFLYDDERIIDLVSNLPIRKLRGQVI